MQAHLFLCQQKSYGSGPFSQDSPSSSGRRQSLEPETNRVRPWRTPARPLLREHHAPRFAQVQWVHRGCFAHDFWHADRDGCMFLFASLILCPRYAVLSSKQLQSLPNCVNGSLHFETWGKRTKIMDADPVPPRISINVNDLVAMC